jgi:FKBP-type peptidyl-prolyl cis-trans isomerase
MNSKLVIFVIACSLGVGAILVFAKNNMTDQKPSGSSGDVTYSTGVSGAPSPVSNQLGGTAQVAGAQTQDQQPESSQVQQQNQAQAQTQAQSQGNSQPSNSLTQGPITQLMIKDLTVGNGAEVKTGDTVEVNYLGTFLDGRKFDSSYDHGQTFSFTVGAGNVIKGWDQGLVGMKVGGKRQLVIPSDLAYGAAGAPGAIPPNTPLAFEIELISIK